MVVPLASHQHPQLTDDTASYGICADSVYRILCAATLHQNGFLLYDQRFVVWRLRVGSGGELWTQRRRRAGRRRRRRTGSGRRRRIRGTRSGRGTRWTLHRGGSARLLHRKLLLHGGRASFRFGCEDRRYLGLLLGRCQLSRTVPFAERKCSEVSQERKSITSCKYLSRDSYKS